jgi:adenosylcobinamide kinase / adenosylcobinamide-phosphate guanylyltransferase
VSGRAGGSRVALVGGGTRSGKSAFGLALARTRGARRVFVATAQAFDVEMQARIVAHRLERGPDFRTVEEPLALAGVLSDLRDVDVVVIDCVTLWLSNLLLSELDPAAIEARIGELSRVLEARRFHSVIVTNEVGMGIVPETPLGRSFRDLSGLANQRLSAIADDVYWAMLGSILRVRPGPVSLEIPGSPA